jgi:excisionase family DNA binding protein
MTDLSSRGRDELAAGRDPFVASFSLEPVVEAVVERVLERLRNTGVAAAAANESPYMTVAEAAGYLRCARQRVDDLLSQRRLTRIKEGSRTLVLRAEVERHLKRHPARGDA